MVVDSVQHGQYASSEAIRRWWSSFAVAAMAAPATEAVLLPPSIPAAAAAAACLRSLPPPLSYWTTPNRVPVERNWSNCREPEKEYSSIWHSLADGGQWP